MWYRGGWCPYCNVKHFAMQQKLAAIKIAGAKLVALTPVPDSVRWDSEC
jgi:peroxiredoxin